MVINQKFEWVQTLPLAWKLSNTCGLKVWLTSQNLGGHWFLYIGDDYRDKLGTGLSENVAKRMAVGKVNGYLIDFQNQLKRALNTHQLY